MLAAAIAEAAQTTGAQQGRMVWWLLFDLYQVCGRRDDFDNL
jgi:hypothetical protein